MSQPTQPQPASHAPPSAPGRFVWHDLMTTDPARALPFYTALFGWRPDTRPMDGFGDYTMFHLGDAPLGGMVPLDPAHGVASHWISYVTVPSVDAACERAAELGGAVGVPPTDIPGVGRFAVVGDRAGAYVSPFTFPDGEEPPEHRGPVPDGGMVWHELMTPDPARERDFHAAIFGWRFERMEMDGLGDYWVAYRGDQPVAGVGQLPADLVAAGAAAHWLLSVQVADVDRSAERAAELGGAVVVPPEDVPDIGRFAVLRDPAGALVALLRPLPTNA